MNNPTYIHNFARSLTYHKPSYIFITTYDYSDRYEHPIRHKFEDYIAFVYYIADTRRSQISLTCELYSRRLRLTI